jgi:hypothetical protein
MNFLEKFENTEPYNTLFVDKNCISCQSGFGPQVLTQIKAACLSYVNSPIEYNNEKFHFKDILFVKEKILKEAAVILEEMN